MSPTVEVYYCLADAINQATEEELHLLLDKSERERYRRMQPAVAARFLQGRRMVRYSLARLSGRPLAELRFSYSPNGKPSVAALPDWHFSISHCASTVVVAIGNCPLGVDVEEVQRKSVQPPWQQPQRYLHPRTARWVERAEEGEKAGCFTLLWTLLESYVKLNDSSIFRVSRQLPIELQVRQALPVGAEQDCHWWAWRPLVGDDTRLALALAQATATVNLWRWSRIGNQQALEVQPLIYPAVG